MRRRLATSLLLILSGCAASTPIPPDVAPSECFVAAADMPGLGAWVEDGRATERRLLSQDLAWLAEDGVIYSHGYRDRRVAAVEPALLTTTASTTSGRGSARGSQASLRLRIFDPIEPFVSDPIDRGSVVFRGGALSGSFRYSAGCSVEDAAVGAVGAYLLLVEREAMLRRQRRR